MTKMNAEIKKFWEHQGYALNAYLTIPREKEGLVSTVYAEKEDFNLSIGPVAFLFVDKPFLYRFNEKDYTEEQMLKIINLKAFL